MDPFNLTAALAGEPVIQRNGMKATVIGMHHGDVLVDLTVLEDDGYGSFTEVELRTTVGVDGVYRAELGSTDCDLFMVGHTGVQSNFTPEGNSSNHSLIELRKPQPEETGVGKLCAPGPADQQEQRWLLVFDDVDRKSIPIAEEVAARNVFASAELRGWNCYLFQLAQRSHQSLSQLKTNQDAHMEYKVVTAESSIELEEAINELLAQGWMHAGGVSVAVHSSTVENERKGYTETYTQWIFAQAMTRCAASPAVQGGEG